jgi:mono/diheme cytochrome c family protein
MSTRIFIGIVMFLAMFVAGGYVLLNEGLFDVQAEDESGRMQIVKNSQDGLSIERGADIFEQYCRTCHGDKGEGVPGRGPQLNPYLFTTRFPELKANNYPNTLENFVKLTVAAGRPLFSTYWSDKGEIFAENMPTWSQDFGGPLRPDRVQDVVSYILSLGEGTIAEPIVFDAVGSDTEVELPAGDAARGQQLWNKEVSMANGLPAPCSACHTLDGTGSTGPSLQGVAERAATRVAGQDAATYIRHSIQLPSEFIVEGFAADDGVTSIMPANLGNSMSAQDLADLIAFLLTQ